MQTPVIVAAIATVAVLGIGGATTEVGAWYAALRKPEWNPPNWLFGPAWTVILGLAAWAGVLAWDHAADGAQRLRVIVLFAANALFHMAWSPLFFTAKRPDWALLEVPFLWLSIVALILGLSPIDNLCGVLLAPYLLWVSFAAFLNWTIVRLNRPAA